MFALFITDDGGQRLSRMLEEVWERRLGTPSWARLQADFNRALIKMK